MWVTKNLSKVGLLFSFLAATAYELTGIRSLKAISLVVGIVSLYMIISHISSAKYINKAKDILHYTRLMK